MWSLASFWARESPLPLLLDLRPPLLLRSRNSVARKQESLWSPFSILPQAKLWGQRPGTAERMAFREACSPENIVTASGPGEVLMKKVFEGVVEVVMRKVEENPLPP